MDFGSSSSQLRAYIIAFFSLLLLACQNPLRPSPPSYTQNTEGTYCGADQAKSYSGAVTTVSGTAQFYYRPLVFNNGLWGDPLDLGVTYAEVHIVDNSGNIIQCGETNAYGAYSLTVPQVPGTYIVEVLSRSQSAKVKASVLKDIYSAFPYSVSKYFNIAANATAVAVPTIDASARISEHSDLPGGAFNILANIFWANEFIREKTANTSFVADKATIFWKQGFNPYSYYNAPNSLASFYIATDDRLFILGGKNGDVKNSDTDHFDDSVILHEYGHFLEAHYGRTDTPGGSHNGNFIIDPRLAWSEGWANYFQAAVLNNITYSSTYTGPKKGTGGFPYYADTLGFSNDSVEGNNTNAGILIKAGLADSNAAAAYDKTAPNEGIFREFSISRTLYISMSAVGGPPFAAIWSAFKELSNPGAAPTPHKFLNFGVYNSVLNGILTASYASSLTAWNSVLSEENQSKTTALYGRYIASTGSTTCSTMATMAPVQDASLGYDRSNQLMSNDFYTFYHDGTSKKIVLKTSVAPGGDIIDMNLYLYADDYYYSEEIQENQANFSNSTLVKTSKALNLGNLNETESVDLSGLPAGYYMINVKASTYNKLTNDLNGTVNYYLYIGDNSTVTTCLN